MWNYLYCGKDSASKTLIQIAMASDNQIIAIGYGSKLFRDNIAAEYCDQEKQLHPHELDHLTTIDR